MIGSRPGCTWRRVREPVGDIGRTHHRVVVHQHELIVGCDGDVGLPHVGADSMCLAGRDKGVLRCKASSSPVSDDGGHAAVSVLAAGYEEMAQ